MNDLIIIYIFLIIAIVLIIMLIKWAIEESDKEKEEMKSVIDSQTDFSATKIIENKYAKFYFANDETKNEFFIVQRTRDYPKKINQIRFKYKDIVEVEIKVDGDTTVSRKSASIGGALAGGVIAGGIGAVVGGSSLGKTTSKKEVSSIDVHILLRDCPVDSFDVKCLPYSCKTDDHQYKESIANVQKIFDALRLAMDKVKETPSIQPISPKSDVEELKELANLRSQGVITEEEFLAMKAKILNR